MSSGARGADLQEKKQNPGFNWKVVVLVVILLLLGPFRSVEHVQPAITIGTLALKYGVDRGMLEEIWDVLSESFGMGSGYADYEDDEYLIETD